MMFFISGTGLPEAIAALIPFFLPGSLIMIFLVLTEKDHNKPWVIKQQAEWIKKHSKLYNNPKTAAKRRLLSGALWIFAIALFITLGITAGFKYSWLVFLFAIGGEALIEFFMISQK